MEPRFQQSFADVRIHHDAESDELTRDLEATAVTVGSDIYFREGHFAPDSLGGSHLLAHELTHAVQQQGAAPTNEVPLTDPDGPAEREAHDVAGAWRAMIRGGDPAWAGEPAAPPSVSTGLGLAAARWPEWLDEASDAVSGAASGAYDAAGDLASDVGSGVSDFAGDAVDTAVGVYDDAAEIASDFDPSSLGLGDISFASSGAMGAGEERGTSTWDQLGRFGSEFGGFVSEHAQGVYGQMKDNASSIGQGVDWVKDKMEKGEDMPGWTDWVAGKSEGTWAEGLGGGLEWAGDQYTSFSNGIGKGALDMGGGLLKMAANPVDTAKSAYNLAEQIPGVGLIPKVLNSGYDIATGNAENVGSNWDGSRERKFFGGLWDGVTKPYKEAYNEEGGPDWSEMLGRGVFDIGSLILGGQTSKGVGGAGMVDDAARAGGLVDDAAKAGGLADDAARARAGGGRALTAEERLAAEQAEVDRLIKEAGLTKEEVAKIDYVPQPPGNVKRPRGEPGKPSYSGGDPYKRKNSNSSGNPQDGDMWKYGLPPDPW